MAEILANQQKQKAGVCRTKKTTLRVDLTPMVDLGFLLISFFVFTTTLSQSTAMKLAMPDDRKGIDSSVIPEKKTLNLILGIDNTTYVYNGLELNNIKDVGGNATSVRDAIIEKKKELINKYGSDSGMVVLIKPTATSTYENVVNALDEMLICNVKTYVLMDATADELKATRQ
ncbi:MAG: biopolymer transporter ExbD [Parafilimonas sp.]